MQRRNRNSKTTARTPFLEPSVPSLTHNVHWKTHPGGTCRVEQAANLEQVAKRGRPAFRAQVFSPSPHARLDSSELSVLDQATAGTDRLDAGARDSGVRPGRWRHHGGGPATYAPGRDP